ncbi:exocyst complex component EXO70H1 [Quercus suber]|uniref:Exocyst subunit Exo70 family protein n=1 Tax=Quercus suber TaxID=58331 RepID=A0AAW0LKL5_QUESU|nr:exocyst complex component EXO70H1-like [Quercus suber]
MPRKGMRSICFNSKTSSFSMSRYSSPARNSISTGTPRRSFSESLIEQSIEAATVLINKWNPETSTYAKVTSLFYESKSEAMQFIRCVNDLQKSMHAMVIENSTSEKLVHAQNLMQIAMKRLQKEFYQILSMNRAHLDPESVSARSSRASARSSISDYDDGSVSQDDEVRNVGDSIDEVEEVSSIAMTDLRSIAECMISTGYAKECISIYKIIRKSIVDEGIYRLGVEKISSSQINKMDWEVLDRRIKDWLEAVKVSMTILFNGERILCDHVFASSDSIRESCFTEISKEGATLLFGFPELVVAKSKKSHPEKIFRVLDMYTAISTNWIEIDSIFSFESTVTVRAQALNSLNKLSDSVRTMLSEFESTMQKDSSKSKIHGGGGVDILTLTTMNYLSLLADYSNILADIFADCPPPPRSSLPESYFESPSTDDSPAPAISMRMAWLILVLLCKLDGKVEHHKDVCLSYIFLANNLNHVVSKVQTSNLKYLLGEDWIAKHEEKVKLFSANYERLAWGPVIATLPENPTATITPAQAKEIFRKFNSSFDETCRKQSSFVVADPKLRDEMKVLLARKIVRSYREFYDAHRSNVVGERNVGVTVRFAPEDVGNYLSDLFFGNNNSSGGTSVSSSYSLSHQRHSWSRG